MRPTLLDMTQNVLSTLGSDEVNSISDTTESLQVANMFKNKFYDIASRGDLPEHEELFQLDAPVDNSTPVLMYVPDGIQSIKYIKYFNSNVGIQTDTNTVQHDINVDIDTFNNPWASTSTTSNNITLGDKTFVLADEGLDIKNGDAFVAQAGANMLFGFVTDYTNFTLEVTVTNKIGIGTYTDWTVQQNQSAKAPPGYQYVTVLPIEQFLQHVNKFNPIETNVQSFTFTDTYNGGSNSFNLYFKTNSQPTYCTIISNYYVIFDSFDVTQDVTLQSSKTMCFGQVIPDFQMEDSFIPDLDDQQFPLLINEVKALAYFELKQTPHIKAEQELKRQWTSVQRIKSVSNKPTYFQQLPDFGRRGGGWL